MFTPRQVEIIEYILNASSGALAKEVSDNFSITSRTLRNEIMEINKPYLDDPIILSNNIKGYFISRERKNEVRSFLYDYNLNQGTMDYKILNTIIFIMVHFEPMNKYDLSEKLFMSETTLQRKISDLNKDHYRDFNKKLILIKSDVVQSNLEEIEVRSFFFSHLKAGSFNFCELNNEVIAKLLNKYINIEEFDKLRKLISDFFDDKGKSVSPLIIDEISSAIYFSVTRDRYGHQIDSILIDYPDHCDNVTQLMSFLNENKITINNGTKKQLQTYLLTYNIFSVNVNNFTIVVADEFIDEVLSKYNFDLKESPELYNNLLLHMEYLLQRIENDYQLNNPIVDHIKLKYPFSYEIAMLLVPVIYKYKKKYLISDEIAYIAIYIEHFLTIYNKKLKVIIMPIHRKAIEDQLIDWLNLNFNSYMDVIDIDDYQWADENYLIDKEIDIIFSFEEAVLHPSIHTYKFYNLPGRKDYNHISEIIYEIKIQQRLSTVIDTYFDHDLINIYKDKVSFEEVIKDLSLIMEEKKLISNRKTYAEDVIEREINYSTFKNNGVMVPHPIFHFSKKMCVGVAILKKPIKIKDNLISVIFLLGTEKKDNSDLGILFSLFDMCAKNNKTAQALSFCDTPGQIIKILKEI